jgi:hypothetical protein
MGRSPKTSEELELLREKIAADNNFKPYGVYSEKEAATLSRYSYSTLKKKRRAKLVPHILRGERISYLGINIADIILGREP